MLLVAPALLCWLWFFGSTYTWLRWTGAVPVMKGGQWVLVPTLGAWAWWGANCVTCFFVIPALIVRFVFKQSLGDFGVTMPAPRKQIPLALILYLMVLPFVFGASRSAVFQNTYPLYHDADPVRSLAVFLAWEGIYLTQFFALEFFFRGFMVFGLEPRFGATAGLVSTVPYCMVHFSKPPFEAFAAIVAGVVLCTVSQRTRSIWSGFMVHGLVAITMDFLALWTRHHP